MNKLMPILLGIVVLGAVTAFKSAEQQIPVPDSEAKLREQAESTAHHELAKLEKYRHYAKDRLNSNLEELAHSALDAIENAEAICQRVIKERDSRGGPEIVKAANAVIDCMGKLYQQEPTLVRYNTGMTLRGYYALKPGMNKIEVDQVLRCNGVEQMRSDSVTVYRWQEGMVQIAVTFEQGRLVSKAQTGLE